MTVYDGLIVGFATGAVVTAVMTFWFWQLSRDK